MDPAELRLFSPATFFLERLFFYAQRLSPANLWLRTHIDVQANSDTPEKIRELTMRRGRRIEAYIFCWFVLEAAVVFIAPSLHGFWLFVLALPAWRVCDLFQSAINVNIFDRLRCGARIHRVASVTRIVILSFWNFIELMLCFGIFYSSELAAFKGHGEGIGRLDPAEAYYFSVVTQLTIGYGDFQAIGFTRLLAATQGLLGFVFAVFVLSRVVAFLPKSESIFDEN